MEYIDGVPVSRTSTAIIGINIGWNTVLVAYLAA